MIIRLRPRSIWGIAFTAGGLTLILFALFFLLAGRWIEQRDRAGFLAALSNGIPMLAIPDPRIRKSAPPPTPSNTATANPTPIALGVLEIERLHLSVLIRNNTSNEELDKGIGWISGTSRPGESGNVALAGHRDTFFRSLRKIERGDVILLRTLHGPRRYVVSTTRIVDPKDVSVLKPTPTPTLTLVTCFPFNYIGSAPKRFIVRATAD